MIDGRIVGDRYARIGFRLRRFRGFPRIGESFGRVETFHLTPNTAIFVPRGCGNSFQALTDDLVYTYLVNAHWSPDAKYSFVNLRDPELNIQWPITITDELISDKDKNHPMLKDVTPLEF